MLLPSRVRVTGKGGQEDGQAYVVVDDGKGATFVQINVQSGMGGVAGDLFGADAETLPNGTLVATHKGAGDDKGGSGLVMGTVDSLVPGGGLRVQLRVAAHRRDPPRTGPDHGRVAQDRAVGGLAHPLTAGPRATCAHFASA
ncbi:hypothetical protein [Streptomyces sp. NPDC006552]|uniref:hypothetical protein n=1 Tax=Streptomyces sp. NPDC006552 TaxID=3157179 RepID=UPI0033A17EB4